MRRGSEEEIHVDDAVVDDDDGVRTGDEGGGGGGGGGGGVFPWLWQADRDNMYLLSLKITLHLGFMITNMIKSNLGFMIIHPIWVFMINLIWVDLGFMIIHPIWVDLGFMIIHPIWVFMINLIWVDLDFMIGLCRIEWSSVRLLMLLERFESRTLPALIAGWATVIYWR
jgi:hypothetical protein